MPTWLTGLTWTIVGAGACHAAMALLLAWNRARTSRLPAAGASALPSPPSVLAVVPARNEEANIGDCVRHLLAQDYPNLRVRVVDDHSTDRTAAVVSELAARDPRLELLHAPELPPGWLGKPHALHAGTRDATADYLWFVDADLRAGPQALRRCIARAEADRAGLLTLVPTLVAESFWERAAQPVVAMLLFALIDPVRARDPRSDFAVGMGPFMLFRRSAYDAIGGHESVATEVVEDLRLAQRIKRAKLGLSYVQGVDCVRLRMYDSLQALVGGWRKNFHIALGPLVGLGPLLALVLLGVFALPTVALGTGVVDSLLAGAVTPLLELGALCFGADYLARASLRLNYGVTLRGVRALGAAVVAYILAASAWRALTGQPVTWRGRSYPSAGPAATPGDGPRQAA
ncbi:MAG: glycosyltransferase [Polyangia bacterium]